MVRGSQKAPVQFYSLNSPVCLGWFNFPEVCGEARMKFSIYDSTNQVHLYCLLFFEKIPLLTL